MRDISLFILIIKIFVDTVSSLSIPTDVHTYCSDENCPPYSLLRRVGKIELRCYKPSIWVSISGRGKLFVDDQKLPIWKLHQFFNGNNTKGVKVPSGPLTTRIFDESRRIFSAEYYIPRHFWKEVPREIDPSLRVIYRRGFCTYVYGFQGWVHSFESMAFIRTEARRLINKFGRREEYYPQFFFYVNYKSKFTHIPQYNEIWYIIKFTTNDTSGL